MRQTVRLCKLDDLADGSARGFDPQHHGSDTVFIVRSGEAVYAYEDKCPHYWGTTSLPWRKDAYLDPFGETIVCAAHGAHFEITTGLCTAGPCLGEFLTRVPLQVREDGSVFAELNDNNGGVENS